ncbi:MAG: laminin G domain-containing protein [Paludibacteraceae bacterium]|nr:laminin G domain-containing protein [Paludibacteraceae bacterium]
MKKRVFLWIALLSLVSNFAWAGGSSDHYWTPNEKYAKWCNAFKVDKMWQFDNEPAYNNGSPGTGTKLVDCPNMISWSIMTWNDKNDSKNDYRFDWLHIYLINTRSNTGIELCYLDMKETVYTSDDASFYNKFGYYDEGTCKSITNHNGCTTTFLQKRGAAGHEDNSMFCYFVTEYSDKVRQFMLDAGGQLAIQLYGSWNGTSWKEQSIQSNNLDTYDRQMLNAPDAPTLSNVRWKEENNMTTLTGHVKGSNETKVWYNINGANVEEDGWKANMDEDVKWNTFVHNSVDMEYLKESKYSISAQTRRRYSFNRNHWRSGTNIGTERSLSSSVATTPAPHFNQPTSFSVLDNGSDVLKVQWTMDAQPASETVTDMSGFIVERSTDKLFRENVSKLTKGYNRNDTEFSIEDTFTERNEGTKTFYYRLRRANAGLDVVRSAFAEINTNYVGIQKMSAENDGSNTYVTWQLDDKGLWNKKTMQLQFDYTGGKPVALSKDITSQKVTLSTCTPTDFTLRVMENGIAVNSHTIKGHILPDETPSVIEKYSVSKGFYNDQVVISWSIRENAANFTMYEVLCRPMDGDTWISLGTQDHKKGIYNYSYTDKTCVPGVYYIYRVEGRTECGGDTRVAATKESVGFAQPYGIVSGQVAFEGNQAVEGVRIQAEGESTRKSSSLFFTTDTTVQQEETGQYKQVNREIQNPLLGKTEGTIEFTFKAKGNYVELLYLYGSGLDIDYYAPELRVRSYGNSSSNYLDNGSVNLDMTKPHYFTHTWKEEGDKISIAFYFDGQKAADYQFTKKDQPPFSRLTSFCAGFYSSNTSNYTAQDVDDVCILDKYLDDATILAHYQNHPKETDAGVVYYDKKTPIMEDRSRIIPSQVTIEKEKADKMLNEDHGSIALWVKPESLTQKQQILYRKDALDLSITEEGKLIFAIKNPKSGVENSLTYNLLDKDSPWDNIHFNNVAVTYQRINNVLTMILVINGRPVVTKTVENIANAVCSAQNDYPLYIGWNGDSTLVNGIAYRGHIDEISFWDIARDTLTITNTYSGYLNGNEVGLTGYYRCDDQVTGELYDLSKTAASFNERHATMAGVRVDVNNVPTADQLGLCTYTDSLGNYLLNAVPYNADGAQYRIIPTLGIHQFAPTNRPLFFDANTSTHNSVDFTDKSSFNVSGTIYYENTDYPVAGCNFYVDGTICAKQGKPIESNEKGQYTISVPIGMHSIEVRKDGHTFAANGRFPMDPENVGTTFDFQTEKVGVDFVDVTKVLLTGRVAGGVNEQNRAHGFQLGSNNIGRARVAISPVTKSVYNLNLSDTTRVWGIPDSVPVHSRTTTRPMEKNYAMYILIETDTATGEFTAQLPPIDMTVDSVTLPGNPNIMFNTAAIKKLELSKCTQTSLKTDSAKIDDKMRMFRYTAALDIIYRVKPTLEVLDSDRDDGLFGISQYLIEDNVHDTSYIVPITGVNAEKKPVYNYKVPFFLQDNNYKMTLRCYERYINQDDTANIRVEDVPVSKSKVTITNQLGNQQIFDRDTFIVDASSGDTIRYEAGNVMTPTGSIILDSLGRGVYQFKAGNPLTIESGDTATWYQLGVGVNYTNTEQTETYDWEMNGNAKGIVLGQVSIGGTNFVTEGPSELLYVLRDPPGSGSSSTWHKGTSITTTKTTNYSIRTYGGGNVTAHIGPEITNASGAIAFYVITDIKSKDAISTTQEGGDRPHHENSTTVVITAATDISTSTDSWYVGSMGDIFVGYSTNLNFGTVKDLGFRRDTDGTYFLNVERMTSVGKRYATQFAFTQREIIETEIPNYIRNRNGLLTTLSDAEYRNDSINNLNNSDEYRYITRLKKDNQHFGEEGTYYAIAPKAASAQNMVRFYNNQIAIWKETLAKNEQAKVDAIYNNAAKQHQNFSVDGGTIFKRSAIHQRTDAYSEGEQHYYDATYHNEFGLSVCGVGVTSWQELKREREWGEDSTKATITDIEVEYTIAQHPYEKISFDVYEGVDAYSPIYAVAAGQTYCPIQKEELTQYYEPGQYSLSTETQAMEVPAIRERDGKTEVNEIPVGGRAEFHLTLNNESDVSGWTTMRLRLMEDGAADGAVLTVDGMPLTGEGRPMRLTAGQQIDKTLFLSQGSLDKLSYKNIGVILSSDCMESTGDTLFLSASFVAACPACTLHVDRTVTNSTQGTEIRCTVSGYDRNLTTFKGIRLEYKKPSDVNWQQIVEVAKADLAGTYSTVWDMHDLTDGEYQLRAVSMCDFGNQPTDNEGEPILITKDVSLPTSLGLPSPINGIYTSDNEVYVNFNEPIQTGLLKTTNVEVTGVLNARVVQHDVAYYIRPHSDSYAATDAVYDLSEKDFSIQAWVRWMGGEGSLISHGHGINIGINATGHLTFGYDNKGNSDGFTANQPLPKDQWTYIAITMQRMEEDSAHQSLKAYMAYGDQSAQLLEAKLASYARSEAISLGDTATDDDLHVAIHDLQLWNTAMSWASIRANMYETKELYRDELYGYWLMNEGEGIVLKDKMRSRHMTAHYANWYNTYRHQALHLGKDTIASMYIADRQITEEDDYCLQFWFRTSEPGQLFAQTAGDSLTISINTSLVIGQSIFGVTSIPLYQNYCDGQWHHFAIITHRNSENQLLLDGVIKGSSAEPPVRKITGSEMLFGDTTTSIDIDEISLMKASISAKWIAENYKAQVSTREAGLMSYFTMDNNLKDIAEDTLYSHRDLIVRTHGQAAEPIYVADAPTIRQSKHEETVAHTFTASEEKLVINIKEAAARIEGCTLNFKVTNIVDKNGNYSDPILWSAYVKRNNLNWYAPRLYLEKEILKTCTTYVMILNNSGQSQSWEITNIPDYITLEKTSGTLAPMSWIDMELIVDASLGIGSYDPVIYLVGNEGIYEPCEVNIRVTGDRPDWTLNPAEYENSMNLIAAIHNDPRVVIDTADIVAAFIDGKVAGIASPIMLPGRTEPMILMDIYANEARGKEVTFRYWDASSGTIYTDIFTTDANDIALTITFEVGRLYGTLQNPVRLALGYMVEQAIHLVKGWNWTSFNVKPNDPAVNEALAPLLPYIQQIKTQTTFAELDSIRNILVGNMTLIDVYKAYKTYSFGEVTKTLIGAQVNPSAVPMRIAPMWNWIGYVPSITLSVNMALSNMNPQMGDIIKARSGFAVWEGTRWIGSLEAMAPGQGYLYYSNSKDTVTFYYPNYFASTAAAPARVKEAEHYSPIPAQTYPGNMTITAIVKDGEQLITDAEVAVFVNDECRAAALPIGDRWFITVPGDEQVTMQFRVWYNEQEYIVERTATFVEDSALGNYNNPYIIQIGEETDIHHVDAESEDNSVIKVIENDHVYIIKNGVRYDILGTAVE